MDNLLDVPDVDRHPKVNRLIKKMSEDLIYGRFSSYSELVSDVYSSLVTYLIEKGELRLEPFDKSANKDATLSDISDDSIEWFLRRAKAERGLPMDVDTSKDKLLTHLNLLNNGRISNAALLLFGNQPQRFFLSSEVKCAHFPGTTVEKPIPYYQVYKGNLFELVDQAVNFILSKIDYAVGTRSQGSIVPTAYEIPPEAIEEAIVNAIAHRDYDSTSSVQVMLFADRLEIRNPGQLPPALTMESLKEDHSSYPKNPLIAESLYLAKYIERMGTGIQDIVKHCLEYGLPEPEFKMTDSFVAIIYRKNGIAFEKVGGQTGGQIGGQIGGQLSETQQNILTLLTANNKISRKEIALNLHINESAIQKHLDKLRKLGVIERIGGTRGSWKISD